MSDHDFEKQVQQKLDELKLRPSGTVWMEVEKNIRTTKRRRRFFWLWTPMVLLCLSTSAYILYRNYFKASQTTGIAQTISSSKSNELTAETKTTRSLNHNPVNDKVAGNSQPESTVAGQVTSNTNNPTVPQNAQVPAEQPTARPSLPVEQAPGKTAQSGIAASSPNSIPNDVNATGTSAEKHVGNRRKKNPVTHFQRSQTTREQRGSEEKTNNSSNNVNLPQVADTEHQSVPSPVQEDFAASIPGIINDDNDKLIATDKALNDSLNKKMIRLTLWQPLNNTPAVAAVPIPRKRTSAWHWGIEANAGLSRISTSNLFHLKDLLGENKYIAEDIAARSNLNAAYANPNSLISIQTTSRAERKAAPIQPDFSYTAGLFVQRSFSRRFRLSAGVRYAYMSVNTEVGEQVVSNTPVLVNYGQTSAAMVYEYYNYAGANTKKDTGYSITNAGSRGTGSASKPAVSQRYKYSFQYIEIPVMAHWQINKGRRLPPIVFDGGFSVARLTKVKALHYDGSKGIYFEDNSLFNKTQFNIITGISVGILQNTKHPMWIGPDLRYSFSGLVKKEASNGQYLWSTGITVKMLLGRL